MTKLILAYCIENQYVAAKIAAALNGKTNVEKVAFDGGNSMEALKKASVGNTTSVLLLLSDNFLKSERCMSDALATIQNLGNAQRLFTVTTDGVYAVNGEPSNVPTTFDRVSSVIQYMNFWQDRYLELRKIQPTGDESAWNERVRSVRSISSEIGELLRYLRSTEYFAFDQFEDSDYVILYRLLNLPIPENAARTRPLEVMHTAMPELEMVANGSNGVHHALVTEGVLEIENKLPEAPNLADIVAPKVEENLVSPMQEAVIENVIEVQRQDTPTASKVIDNQLVIDTDAPITESKPLTFEDMMAGIRNNENYQIKADKVSESEPTADQPNAHKADRPITSFSIEEILKDEELQEIMRQKAGEETVTESIDSLFDELILDKKVETPVAVPTTNLSVDLDEDENDLINLIATEAAVSDTPNTLIANKIEATFSENTQDTEGVAEELEIERELLSDLDLDEKTDADLRALAQEYGHSDHKNGAAIALENVVKNDLDDAAEIEVAEVLEVPELAVDETEEVSREVSRIFDEAENADAQFEFEAEDNDPEWAAENEALEMEHANSLSETVENQSVNDENAQPMKINRYAYAAQLTQENRHVEAIEQLELLLENDRANIDAYVLMAYLAEQQGDYTLSLNSLEKVSLLNPSYPGIFYKLGRLTNEHFRKQNRKALRYFQDAVAQDPGNADAQFRYAKMLVEQNGDFPNAIEHLTIATENAPQHDQAAFELAKAYFEINDRANAATWYGRATELNPAFKTDSNDQLFHYVAPLSIVEPTVNDNGITVLITGATSGIGQATAEIFAKNGYRLILTGRRNDRLDELKTQFETEHHNLIQLLNFDVRDRASVKEAINNLPEDWRNVDILINNAGLAAGLAPIHEGEIDDWDVMIDTNIKGLLYMTRAIAPQMVARGSGHIINLSSIAGKEIYPNGNVYNASKTAVDALTRAMRVDLYKYNIRVSQVAPGAVEETEFAKVRFHGDTEKAKIYEDFMPLKASDVADTIYYIVTRPEYVNIQDVVMMGTQQAGANWVDRSGRKDRS